ncbi:MAG: TorF family putative porin [Tepidisphaerales bacterium]
MRRIVSAAVLLGLGLGVLAEEAKDDAAKSSLPFTIDVALDLKTVYVFRGYKLMDSSDGLIFQPAVQLTLNRIDKAPIGITPYAGAWFNFSTDPTGYKNWENWSETDLNAGVKFDYGKWTLDVLYNQYLYPNGFAGSSGEIGLILGYNDEELAKKIGIPFALNPHLGFYQQVYDNGDHRAKSYLELGVRPEFKKAFGFEKLTLAVPVNLGMSTDKFYTTADGGNDFFGYANAAVELRYQLTEHWFVKTGVEYDYLMANSVRQANEDSSSLVVGTLGLGCSY